MRRHLALIVAKTTVMNGSGKDKKQMTDKKEAKGYDNVSLRFPKGQRKRLQMAAEKVGLTQNDLIRMAATVIADHIEKTGKIVLPCRFVVQE